MNRDEAHQNIAPQFAQLLTKAARNLQGVGPADDSVAQEALKEWPYCVAAQIIALQCRPSGEELRARIALAVDCPATVDRLRRAGWNDFYPPQPEPDNTPDTTDAISLFLDKYGHQSPEEDALLERMIFNPTPDYAEVLAREEQENLPSEPVDPDSPEGRIDAFILSKHPAAAPTPVEPPEPAENRTPVHKPTKDVAGESNGSLLSESLAAVYIRQGRYERAYDILSELSKKYPRRNVILLPQLAFLRKLIKNAAAGGR